MSRLPYPAGRFALNSYRQSELGDDQTLKKYLINHEGFASLGICFGMIAVARLLTDGQKPLAGSLCLAWISGVRYLLRVNDYPSGSVRLDDGEVCKKFWADDVRFEATVLYVRERGGSVGMFCADANGLVTHVSDSWLMLAGGTSADWLGEAWAFKIHPKDRKRVYHLWYNAIHEGVALVLSARVKIRGVYLPYTVIVEPRRDASARVIDSIGFITLGSAEGCKGA